MAWVRTITDEEADGLVAREFGAARKRAGRVYEIVRLHSLDAPSMRDSMRLYVTIMQRPDGALPRVTREMLATVVSRVNDCFY